MEEIRIYLSFVARGLELLGVATIAFGVLIALGRYLFPIKSVTPRNYKTLRRELGKAILLGLEILVAGDIIATVITDPTMNKVLILAMIVLIRTFLSLSIEVEIEGKLPWN
ncbi:hypothetical protein A4H97_30150 [Niastella yeongjuensis]|uniref:DUF1622 domain-containing protein n=1 Tax=Niastella yeongjuensis TaxID=354355 RepID=A0A1V9EPQ3_9BACT|nr:DUF1622 domain-containing protein [Niastella yeongjuensis]OQP48096.1 hypothetical protein A4H97_30150 [Niastella yeongjuensis]SEO26548.1 Uncharacterized membrane protein [Niastella yeongjuensis]